MSLFNHSFSAFLTCLTVCLILIRLAPTVGLLDFPGGRRQHLDVVPKVGGLALIATLLLGVLLRRIHVHTSPLESSAILSLAILGVIDDRFDLRARYKAGLGFILALGLALATTYRLFPGLSPVHLFGLIIPPIPSLVFALLVFMYLCIPQALNLIDGANGLATGFSLVVTGCLWAAGDPHPFLAGVLLACMVLNWPKARLFLGDCGSLSIGMMLVIFAQKKFLLPNPNHLLWLFAYPAVDVITVTLIRLFTNRPIFEGDRNHLHFQLGDRWPRHSRLVVPVLLALAAICGSEIFVHGHFRIIPYMGLVSLGALSSWLVAVTVMARGLPADLTTHPKETEVTIRTAASEPVGK